MPIGQTDFVEQPPRTACGIRRLVISIVRECS
jgi:hypothetical protein